MVQKQDTNDASALLAASMTEEELASLVAEKQRILRELALEEEQEASTSSFHLEYECDFTRSGQIS